jgi:hypothetical protein
MPKGIKENEIWNFPSFLPCGNLIKPCFRYKILPDLGVLTPSCGYHALPCFFSKNQEKKKTNKNIIIIIEDNINM